MIQKECFMIWLTISVLALLYRDVLWYQEVALHKNNYDDDDDDDYYYGSNFATLSILTSSNDPENVRSLFPRFAILQKNV